MLLGEDRPSTCSTILIAEDPRRSHASGGRALGRGRGQDAGAIGRTDQEAGLGRLHAHAPGSVHALLSEPAEPHGARDRWQAMLVLTVPFFEGGSAGLKTRSGPRSSTRRAASTTPCCARPAPTSASRSRRSAAQTRPCIRIQRRPAGARGAGPGQPGLSGRRHLQPGSHRRRTPRARRRHRGSHRRRQRPPGPPRSIGRGWAVS